MTTDLATRSADAARRIATAKRGRAFDDAVREFVRLLRSVPDSAVAEWSDDMNQIRTRADEVISRSKNIQRTD